MMLANKFRSLRGFLAIFMVSTLIALFPMAKRASAISIVLSIPEKYSEVKVGEKIYFQTEVKWPENTGRKDLRVEYSVKDGSGKEVAYLKVLKAIETQASFMDSITISDSTPAGLYKIEATISDYKNLSEVVTASFEVAKGSVAPSTYIYIIIGLVGVIIFFIINSLYVFTKRNQVEQAPGLARL